MKKYNYYKDDLDKSVEALKSIKENILKKIFRGNLYNIETSKNNILILLDQKSGIDFIREDETGLQGIACRVQWIKSGRHPFNSFTIRLERYTKQKTEFEKRKEQITNGYFYPAFTLQAYFDETTKKLLSIGVIKTNKLYEFIENYPDQVYENKSDNVFKFVRFEALKDFGIFTLYRK